MTLKIREKIRNSWAFFLATSAVSRPLAYMMAIFFVLFVASLSTGAFLVGRWGYNQINKSDAPVAVVVPDTKVANSSGGQPTPQTSQSQVQTQKDSTNTQKPPTDILPNTGVSSSLWFYAALVLVGYATHAKLNIYRVNRKSKKT